MKVDPEARVQGFTFEECLAEFPEDEFPALRASLEGASPARSTKIEWLYDGEDGKRYAEFNYTQIFRKVNDDPMEGLRALLEEIEDALVNGERDLEISGREPTGRMGGSKFFESAEARIRPLQQPVLLKGGGKLEWLAEVSADFLYMTRAPETCATCGRPR